MHIYTFHALLGDLSLPAPSLGEPFRVHARSGFAHGYVVARCV